MKYIEISRRWCTVRERTELTFCGEPISWAKRSELKDEPRGRLCPKCHARFGAFDWAALRRFQRQGLRVAR